MVLKRNPAKSHVRMWLANLRSRRKQILVEFARKNMGKPGMDGVLAST